MAESVGFEPTVPFGTSDFKSGAFGHSANSPFVAIITYYDMPVKALIIIFRLRLGYSQSY